MIQVRDLTVRFENKVVLDNVSCDIPTEMITSIIGKSGMGKSVLMKAVMSLLPYQSGEITIDHLSTKTDLSTIRKKMAMLFQNSALFDSMNIFQNIGFPLFEHTSMPYEEIRSEVKRMIDLVKLPDIMRLYPAELSGGMRKRVALARAIIQKPEYLIYDEPTTGLDPITAEEIIHLIGSIHRELSMTSIIITHDPECIKTLTENLIIVDEQKIIYSDSFDNFMIFNHPTGVKFREHIFSN